MRTTLDIDEDVLAAARAMAAERRQPLGRVVSDLIRCSIAPRATSTELGVPVFDVPADAPPITPGMVERALDHDA